MLRVVGEHIGRVYGLSHARVSGDIPVNKTRTELSLHKNVMLNLLQLSFLKKSIISFITLIFLLSELFQHPVRLFHNSERDTRKRTKYKQLKF